MIGKIMRQIGFIQKQAYIVDQADARVLGYRNLFGADSHDRALSMEASAGLNKRVAKPVIHIPIRAAKTDRELSDKEWMKIADRILKRLGLSEHQAMIVRHGKGSEQHIHLLVNRIHPITFKAAPMKNDLRAIQSELRSIEKDMNLKQIGKRESKAPAYSNGEYQQGLRAKKIATDRHRKVTRIAWGAAKDAKPAGRIQVFHDKLNEFGFQLAQGQKGGFVVVGPDGTALSLSKALRISAKERRKVFTDKKRATLPTLDTARRSISGEYSAKTAPSKDKTLRRPPKPLKKASFSKSVKAGINTGRFIAAALETLPTDGDEELEYSSTRNRPGRYR